MTVRPGKPMKQHPALTADSPLHVVFAVRVREERVRQDLTQSALDVKPGYPERAGFVAKIERARYGATLGTVARIAGALGVNPVSLLERPARDGGAS